MFKIWHWCTFYQRYIVVIGFWEIWFINELRWDLSQKVWVPNIIKIDLHRHKREFLFVILSCLHINVKCWTYPVGCVKEISDFGSNVEHAFQQLYGNFLRRRPISSLPQKRALHNFQNSSRSDRTIMLVGWWKCVRGGVVGVVVRGGIDNTTFSSTLVVL